MLNIDPTMPPLEILKLCEGYYSCPIGPNGEFLGPLVGYAGKYDGTLHYVGTEYFNWAMLEERPALAYILAQQLGPQVNWMLNGDRAIDTFCGAPEGGKAPAIFLGCILDKRYIYPEKQLDKTAAETGQRAEFFLEFIRHQVKPGERIVLCEDLLNNFSTTAQLIEIIMRQGATVVGIAAWQNRSTTVDRLFTCTIDGKELTLPVICLVYQPIEQFRQDDSTVAEAVAADNVAWKPKDEWPRLKAAMDAYPATV